MYTGGKNKNIPFLTMNSAYTKSEIDSIGGITELSRSGFSIKT